MLLTIDIGNSNIVFGLPAGEGRARRLYRLGTVPERPAEEYFTLADSLFAREGVDLSQVDGAVICSVVPVLVPVLKQVVQRLTGIVPYVINPRSKSGLTLSIPESDTLGSDILAGDAAAAAEYPLPALIFDMGTATTLSVVDREGIFRGGMILPGLRLSVDALSARAAQLPCITFTQPEGLLGTDTVSCMRSGALYGAAAALEGISLRLEEELGPVTVVLTGGHGRDILPLLRRAVEYEPHLQLMGLRELWLRSL